MNFTRETGKTVAFRAIFCYTIFRRIAGREIPEKESGVLKYDFIADLDDYFCEKYANYDRLCVLKGYSMPKMQAVKRLEDGRDYAYTLPASTMRLSLQKEKETLLRELKEGLFDASFSFSFKPLSFWTRVKGKFKKKTFAKVLPEVLKRKNLTVEEVGAALPVDAVTWKRIATGKYEPTKNLLLSVAICFGLSDEDVAELMEQCELGFDFTDPKDVVAAYLITRKITNEDMVKAALEEYKISNLYLIWDKK